MTNSEPDPVNRWATEHYGFEPEATDRDAKEGVSAASPVPPRPAVSHRRAALIASGVLSLSLVAGIGGAAVAVDAGGDGPGGGGAGTSQFDGGDGNGRGGDGL